jgi:hypothetical protein
MKRFGNKLLILLAMTVICDLGSNAAFAQQDTSGKQTIEITSAYKPTLRPSVKINLYASPMEEDTTRPRLSYNIPAQNLYFSYQPVALQALALDMDTALHLGDRNQLKLGFGSFTTPYVNGAFSFGDGKKNLLNVYGNYISSRGNIVNQDFSEMNVKGVGSIYTPKNEVYANVGFAQHEYYQWGYNHAIDSFAKSQIRRSYQDFYAGIGIRNKESNDLNFTYDPHLEVHEFARETHASETSLLLWLPAEKKFSESVSFKMNITANLDKYLNKDSSLQVNNNLFQIAPEFDYYSDKFSFHGGVTPSWNNNEVAVLPNIYAEAKLKENILMIQAGWVGSYIANSFRTLSGENPYMQDPVSLMNTKQVQYYGGIKATAGNHFSFNARAAYINYKNMPLFINDTLDGKSFYIRNESNIDNFQIHGDMNFINQDKFSLTAGLDMNTYTGLHDNAKAWGLIPLQLTGSLRWYAFKQLLIKGDVMAFSGVKAPYKDPTSTSSEETLPGGTDLSVGAEFKITEQFSAWLDFDNLLNSKYERWNNYPVYGLQVIGGILIHFK